MSWAALHHLGNLTLTLPLAGAIAAWLLAARNWRAALYWLALFASALSVVGISKVAFLGWGTAIPALGFKAFSGHAAGVAALYPVLFYLLLRCFAADASWTGFSLGLALAALVAFALVEAGEHSAAEACAGWLVGTAASAATIRVTHAAAPPRAMTGLACALIAFGAASMAMRQAQVGYWMIKVALALSGNTYPFRWDSCG